MTSRKPITLLRYDYWVCLVCVAALFFVTTGFSGLIPPGLIRPVALEPFLDRLARLTMLHNSTPVRGGTLVAVIVDFEGYGLAVTSTRLTAEPSIRGTVGKLLAGKREPHHYDLFEVRNRAGRILGYLLMHGERVESYFLDNDKEVFIDVAEVLTP